MSDSPLKTHMITRKNALVLQLFSTQRLIPASEEGRSSHRRGRNWFDLKMKNAGRSCGSTLLEHSFKSDAFCLILSEIWARFLENTFFFPSRDWNTCIICCNGFTLCVIQSENSHVGTPGCLPDDYSRNRSVSPSQVGVQRVLKPVKWNENLPVSTLTSFTLNQIHNVGVWDCSFQSWDVYCITFGLGTVKTEFGSGGNITRVIPQLMEFLYESKNIFFFYSLMFPFHYVIEIRNQ